MTELTDTFENLSLEPELDLEIFEKKLKETITEEEDRKLAIALQITGIRDDNRHKKLNLEPKLKIVNKGTGAGGSRTNKNGLSFEDKTIICKSGEFKIGEKLFIRVSKNELFKFLKKDYVKCEKKLNPDEAFIDIENKKIFVIEKKFQQCSGSVDEKIQTAIFKKEFYEELYPTYEINYSYCLSNWFKKIKYKPEMRFFKKYNIPIFWGEDENYVDKIKKWLLS